MMLPRLRLDAAVLLLLLSAPAPAAAQEPADTLPDYLLEGVTVTTRRTPTAVDASTQKVEVLTNTDLRRTVGVDVADALKENLGLDVIQYPGLLSGVSVRGFRPQFFGINPRTLILLDGRPAGVTNLATLDLATVERIEVLKGPASALYGSSAMGGVVNVVTRRTEGALAGEARAAYGTFGTYRARAAIGGDLRPGLDFDLVLAAGGRRGGYDVGRNRFVAADSVTKTLEDGSTLRLPEISVDTTLTFSDYATRSGSLRLGYDLGSEWRIHARGGFFAGEDIQNPGDLIAGFGRTLNDVARHTGELGVAGDLGRHALGLRAYASREVTSYYDDPLSPSFVSFRNPTRWYGGQVQDVISLGSHSLTAGLDYTAAEAASERFVAEGESAPPYSPDSAIRSAAAFAELRLELLDGRLATTAGGRLDRVGFEVEEAELFDGTRVSPRSDGAHTVVNPSLGVLYRPGSGVRLHASMGRAFVTPEAFNVAGYAETRLSGRSAVRVARGNPELEPESSVSWDAGVGIHRPVQGLEGDLTYFRTDVRDRITPVPVPVEGVRLTPGGDTIVSVLSYANADRAEIRGVEGRISYDLGARTGFAYSLRAFLNATRILRAEEISAGVRSDVRNVSDLTVVGGLDYDDLDRFGARLSGRYVGERLDTDWTDWLNPGDVRYPAFLVLDLSARVRLGSRYRLEVEVDNLTDENYYEVRGYNLPGRSLLVGFSVELDRAGG